MLITDKGGAGIRGAVEQATYMMLCTFANSVLNYKYYFFPLINC